MMKKILKTVSYEGYKLELVEVDIDKFEILINGKLKVTEYDYYRACETFQQFANNY